MATTTSATDPQRHAGIGDDAVKRRTGRGWEEWFELLDQAGAKELEHPEIARWLDVRHGAGAWWSQMITVAYEQARGRRVRHERAGGDFAVSATRTIAAKPSAIWKALSDAATRRKWVNAATWKVRTKKAPERMRIEWGKDELVEFRITPKGADKCLVAADHSRLKDAKSAASTKKCWARALDKMRAFLEGNE
jgi:hypothetical protein